MPRSTSESIDLHPHAALYILERLRKAGRVSAAEIRAFMSEMGREIRELEEKLARLREAAPARAAALQLPLTRRGRKPAASQRPSSRIAPPKTTTKKQRRKFTVTPAVLKSRELQGKYLPLLNRMPENKRGYFAKLAKEKGREAAIQEMEAALRP